MSGSAVPEAWNVVVLFKGKGKNTHNGPGVEDNLQRAQRITQSLPNLVRLLGSVESLDLSSADLGTDCAALADRDGT